MMSRARQLKFLLPFCLLLVAPTSYISSQQKSDAVPKGPDAVEVAKDPELIGATSFDYLAEFKVRNVPAGTAVIWDVTPETGGTVLRIIKVEKALLVAGPARDYTLKVRLIKGEDVSEFRKNFKLTGGVVPIPPGPGPNPPGPNPPGPTPTPPAPIPVDGFRVMIVYQDKDQSKYSSSQLAVLYGAQVRNYLEAKTVLGPDGKTKEYRIWDVDVPGVESESKTWQDAFARPHPTVTEVVTPDGLKTKIPTPYLIVSNGKTGWEGPLMPNMPVADVMALLQKYGG